MSDAMIRKEMTIASMMPEDDEGNANSDTSLPFQICYGLADLAICFSCPCFVSEWFISLFIKNHDFFYYDKIG